MHTTRKSILSFTAYLVIGLVLSACAAAPVVSEATPATSAGEADCPSGGEPPELAILSTAGTIIVKTAGSGGGVLAGEQAGPLKAGDEGNKVGWFRPAGADLIIAGHRLDGDAPPLEAEASCCYPTRFQTSGLYFPTEGCWEINAKAAESELTFVVWVQP
jgi:hypothetical protein